MKSINSFNLRFIRSMALAVCLIVGLNFNIMSQGARGAGIVNSCGRLQVSNSHVCAEDGTSISLGGMSLFWSGWAPKYYTAATIDYLVDNFQISLIRAAYGCPENTGPMGDVQDIKNVVEAAIARGIYVIIDWHGEGDLTPYKEQEISFFETMARDYGNYNNVIYELWNEPTYQSTSAIQSLCQDVANAIRNIENQYGYSHKLVICGSNTWSQYPNSYQINDPNAAYTFHGYFDNQPSHLSQLYNNVQAAMNMGNAVFVTEFGASYCNHGNTDQAIQWCQDNNISMAAWSVNDKVEDWSIFTNNMDALTCIGEYYQNKLTAWPLAGGGGSVSGCENITATTIPGKIEAESYCQAEGIQTETCSEGTLNVGYIESGDWMAYKINVPVSGTYTISYRVASLSGGGSLKFEAQGGSILYGSVDVPNTGDWQNWTTVSHDVQLSAGVQNVAIAAITGGWNINWVKIASSDPNTNTIQIEAEDFSYMDGIQVEDCSEGGSNVGYIDAGDWLAYHGINLPAGSYTVEYRVASLYGGGKIQLEQAGGDLVFGAIDVPQTNGWQNWTTISHVISVGQNVANIGIAVPSGGFNLNWIKFTPTNLKALESLDIIQASPENDGLYLFPNPVSNNLSLTTDKQNIGSRLSIYDLSGKILIHEMISGTYMDIDLSKVSPGVYFISVNGETRQLIKQ